MEITQLLKLKVKESDEALYLVWRCPKCTELARFHLISSEAGINLLGVLPIDKPHQMLELRTQCCRYDLKVSVDQRPQLEKVRELTRRLLREELPSADYLVQTSQVSARFMKDLLALTRIWMCATCNEENPASFDVCWNCQSKNSMTELSGDATPIRLPVPPGGNPWEW